MVDDWPSDQMRKDRHEFAVSQEGLVPCLPAIRVDKVGRLREREERDAERQDNVLQMEDVNACQQVRCAEKEIRVFEVAEQHGVDDDAKCKP